MNHAHNKENNMSWDVKLDAEKNPYESQMQKCSLGEHDAKIYSVKSENDDGPMYTKKGEPMTSITLKVVGGDSDGAFISDLIFPDSDNEVLMRLTKSRLYDIGKSAGLTEITGPDSIIGAVVRIDVQQDKKNPEYQRIQYLHMGSTAKPQAQPQSNQRPSLLSSAEPDEIPFQQ